MLILLHGKDTFRSREKLRELREKFLRDVDPSGANLVTIDGATASAGEIWTAVASQSFLVRRRMVVVEGIDQAPKDACAEVAAFLDRIPEDVVLVFCASGMNPARPPTLRSGRADGHARKSRQGKSTSGAPLLPALLEHADHVQEFVPLEGAALRAWVAEHARSCGVGIDRDAIELLAAEVGPDLWRMANEIDKLADAARAAGAETITTALVRAHIVTTPSDDVFAFTDAVGQGDRARAIRLLRDLGDAGVDAFQLVGLLGRQLRLLIAARDLLDRGTTPSRLAVELSVPPFVASKIASQARRSDRDRLRLLHQKLVDLDLRLKSSRAPREVLLELFTLDATAA